MLYKEREFSLDCVTSLNKYFFLTGDEIGNICVWNVSKKNPLITLGNCHKGGWISAIKAFYNSDVLVSGA